eukprot:2390022-Pyramimonas_sp.AAC.1
MTCTRSTTVVTARTCWPSASLTADAIWRGWTPTRCTGSAGRSRPPRRPPFASPWACLLYTSDAADDTPC